MITMCEGGTNRRRCAIADARTTRAADVLVVPN